MAPRCYGNSSIGSCLQCITTKILRPETQVWQLAWRRSLTAWFHVPIGVMCVLLACWGVDSLIGLSSVSFPASVALLIVLFFALIICETILGDRRTKKSVHVIDIPVSFIACMLGIRIYGISGRVCVTIYQRLVYAFIRSVHHGTLFVQIGRHQRLTNFG